MVRLMRPHGRVDEATVIVLKTIGFPSSHKHEEKDHEDHACAPRRDHAV
jgi:hypothetical protein